ncbi:hypothetical protein ACJX0J_028616, partial [Zea mays]
NIKDVYIFTFDDFQSHAEETHFSCDRRVGYVLITGEIDWHSKAFLLSPLPFRQKASDITNQLPHHLTDIAVAEMKRIDITSHGLQSLSGDARTKTLVLTFSWKLNLLYWFFARIGTKYFSHVIL